MSFFLQYGIIISPLSRSGEARFIMANKMVGDNAKLAEASA